MGRVDSSSSLSDTEPIQPHDKCGLLQWLFVLVSRIPIEDSSVSFYQLFSLILDTI